MKQFLYVRGALVAVMFILVSAGVLADVISEKMVKQKNDGRVTFVNTMPMPLGRYVQLAKSDTPFVVSSPDADNSGEITLYFDFEILRHVPNLEFLSFRAESEEIEEHGRRIHIKFKKDQNAVKELCSGVRNERVKHKIVPYSERYSDKVDWEIKNFINLANGKELKFTDSSVYLSVPPSNIKFVGYDSEYLRVSNPAQITFHAKDNGELNISLFIKGVSSNVISYRFRSHAMIRTANGAFEISLDGQQAAAGYPWLYKEEYIAPKDMDVLLSSPVEVVVYVEKHE